MYYKVQMDKMLWLNIRVTMLYKRFVHNKLTDKTIADCLNCRLATFFFTFIYEYAQR